MEIDHRADIFAIGVLLYQALTGTLPQGSFTPPSELIPSTDPRYDMIVTRAMQRDPENRYASCADIEAALKSVVANPAQSGSAAVAPLPGRRLITGSSDSTAQLAAKSETTNAASAGTKKPRGKVRWAPAAVATLALVAWGLTRWLDDGPQPGPADPTAAANPLPTPAPTKPAPAKPKPPDPPAAVADVPPEPEPPVAAIPPEMPDPDPPKPPEPATDDGKAGETALSELDRKLLTTAEPVLADLTAKRDELLPVYLREAEKAEQAAIAAGRLEDLLFWDLELRSLFEKGELAATEASVPQEAGPLRISWQKQIGPIHDQFDDLRLAYTGDCRAKAEEFQQDSRPVSASLLRTRAEQMDSFSAFLTLCGWQPERAPGEERTEIGGTLAELDTDLLAGRISRLPEGTVRFENNHYFLVTTKLNWDAARRWCEQRGGHLATLAREEEFGWFRNSPDTASVYAYLGGQTVADNWQWVTDEPWTGRGWAPGEPKEEATRNVLVWYSGKLGLDDTTPDHRLSFWIEWEGKQFLQGPLARATDQFPAELLPLHDFIRTRLAGQDDEQNKPLIRAYGSHLVKTRRKLAGSGNAEAANAVQAVEQQLLAMLGKGGPAKGTKPAAPSGPSERTIVARGEPDKDCNWDRKLWKRRGNAIETKEWAEIRSGGILGAGDFEIEARLKLPMIGDTKTTLRIGATILELDLSPGDILLRAQALSKENQTGARLAALAKPNEWFDLLVARSGGALNIKVNGKPAFSGAIHDGPAGAVALRLPVPGSGLEHFSARGAWEQAPPKPLVIAGGQEPARVKHGTQLLPAKGEKLVCVFTSEPSVSGLHSLWTSRSTDGGSRWSERELLADNQGGEVPIRSFSAFSDPYRDEVTVLYCAGKSNHRVLTTTSNNGGSSWKPGPDLTEQVKQGGWNVSFPGRALRLSRNSPKPGRAVVPFGCNRGKAESGHEGSDTFILISDDEENWRRIGPVIPGTSRYCEIFEDHQGILRLTSDPSDSKVCAPVLQSTSKDGGETWSEATPTRWHITWSRGSFLATSDSKGKPCWYYCNIDAPTWEIKPYRSNLAIYRSYDQGAHWELLRHVVHGHVSTPTMLRSDTGSLLVNYRQMYWDRSWDSIRFVDIPLQWLEQKDHSLH